LVADLSDDAASHRPRPQRGLVERETELEAIRTASTLAASGRGRLVLVEGPPGIGKSELVEAARSLGPETGTAILSGRGSELESRIPFGLAIELFAGAVAASDPKRVFTGAAALAETLFTPSAEARPSGIEQGFPLVHGLYWLLAALAEERPRTLLVDDAHWADGPSLRFLAYLAERIDGLPVAMVVALRPHHDAADPGAFRQLRHQSGARLLEPAALSPDALATLTRSRFFPDAADAFCAAVHDVTGGNPFLAHELLLALDLDGAPPTAATAATITRLAPEAVVRSVETRLARSGHRSLAEAVAVLDGDAYLRHAAALAGLDLPTAATVTDDLRATSLLGPAEPLGFAHRLVRDAVYQAIPAMRRAVMHRLAYERLRAEGAAPERLAAHLLAAPGQADPEVASLLGRAAGRALATGAAETAVTYLHRALAEPPPPGERSALLVGLAHAESRLGRPQALVHLAEGLDFTDEASRRAAVLLQVGCELQSAGRFREAAEAFGAGLAELGGPVGALGLRLLAGQVGVVRFEPSGRPETLDLAFQVAGKVDGTGGGERELFGELAFETALLGRPAEEVVHRAQCALTDDALLNEAGPGSPPMQSAAFALALADEFDAAEGCLDAAVAEAERQGLATAAATALRRRSWTRYLRGAVAESVADAEQAVAAARHASDRLLAAMRSILAVGLLERGDLHLAGACLDQAEEELDRRGALVEAMVLWARAELHLEQSAHRQALIDARRVGNIMTTTLGSEPVALLPWRSTAARALLAIGAQDEAAELADHELAAANAFGAARPIGVALCSVGRSRTGEESVDRFREAVAVLERSGACLEHARATGELGAALRRTGRRKEAGAVLREALDLAVRCGSTRLAGRVTDELKACGLRPRRSARTGRAALTPSEHRVARLAAEGLSNREIAQRLFVSIKAVEWHLGNAFTKLRITSRRELGDALAAAE
jgi:DNA-binding CsgD family transcriptional regulator